ncbi:MAG: AMMECR1 domain-containing protein, partial [Acidobacteriota bacterium]|nr:AMMECR1 domain-containing protein [Acidobacteriota bacterium]
TGSVPLPVDILDTNYDSRGGVWISLRDRDEIYRRYARNGIWHFPGETRGSTGDDLARAAVQTAEELAGGEDALGTLDRSRIAVTFFGPLEECTVGELDNDRYGIVVCSRERPSQMGGALPRMPGISNEWEQFRHAWRNNAQLRPFEPYRIFRHDVTKAVEPGVQWQPSGVPDRSTSHWYDDPKICGRIAERARDIAIAKLLGTRESGAPLPGGILPAEVSGVFTTVYVGGKLRGCAGLQGQSQAQSLEQSLEDDLRSFVEAAIVDDRFEAGAAPTGDDAIAVTVSFLFHPLALGEMSPEEVRPRFQLGRQALSVSQGRRSGMLLPFVAVANNLDRAAFVAEVIDKAGITRPPYHWLRHDCETWISDKLGCVPIKSGLRLRSDTQKFEDTVRELAGWQSDYLVRMQREDGSLWFSYLPFQNWIHSGGGAPRAAHAAWILSRASGLLRQERIREAADKLLAFHIKALRENEDGIWLEADGLEADGEPSVSELSFLLLALCELQSIENAHRNLAAQIASMLWSRIDRHGCVTTHRDGAAGLEEYQDYFPQQSLLALAAAAAAGISTPQEDKLGRALQYYRHRFRYKRNFGQVSWLMQAGARWYGCTRRQSWSDLVFEIGDWILSFQLEKNGGFISDFQEDGPGYTTALFLEGLSAALDTAVTVGDHARHNTYLQACRKGISFLTEIIVRPSDESILPNGAFTLGGVRTSLTGSSIRTDFVQHSLAAVLEMYSHLGLQEEDGEARETQEGSQSIIHKEKVLHGKR